MSLLGLSSQDEYDALADKLRTYGGAEQFVLDQLAPVVNTMADIVYPLAAGGGVYIGLSYYVLSFSPTRMLRYFLSLIFFVVLMHPIQVSNAQVPWSFFYFNKVTTDVLGLLQKVIDKSIKTPGGQGNYVATVHSLSGYSSGVGDSELRGTWLAHTVEIYNEYCAPAALEQGNFTTAELQAVGLAGGVLGVDVPGAENTRASALQKMRGLRQLGARGPIDQLQHFYILSKSWWLGREGEKNLAVGGLTNNIPDLQYIYKDPGAQVFETDKRRFFARDCADLWRIADMSTREYLAAVAARSKFAAKRAGIAPGEDKDGLVVLGAQITAAQKVNASGEKKEKGTMAASLASTILSGLESMVVTFAMKAVNWFAELVTKWFVFAIPTVAAFAVGLMFVAWPVYVGMALIPGRERSIPQFLSYTVFIKVFLFFSYAILKIGGALFLAAMDKFTRDGDASLASMTFIGGLAILIGVLYGGTALAQAVTFAQAGGLAGALGMGGVGAHQITQAAQRMAQLIPRGRRPRRDDRNDRDDRRGSRNQRSSGVSRGAMPAPGNVSHQSTGRVTHKSLQDRLKK